MENIRKHKLKIYIKTQSNIINKHGQQSFKTMVNNHHQPWSNIVTNNGQQSAKIIIKHLQQIMVTNHQKTMGRTDQTMRSTIAAATAATCMDPNSRTFESTSCCTFKDSARIGRI
jgi:hypothetical protein